MAHFSPTDKTTITRLAKRGNYDADVVYAILDEAKIATLSYADNNQPFQIPTAFCRIENNLYIHGSVGSHYMRLLRDKKLPVCISVFLLDGMVLAKSAFHHSMNYRSVVIFSTPELVTDAAKTDEVLKVFTNKLIPGRWEKVRQPTPNEWKQTMVLEFLMEEASAKIRTGGPVDDEEDKDFPVEAGVIPYSLQAGTFISY